MNTMTTFILIICGLSIMFYVFGISTETNPLLSLLLNPQSMSTSSFYLAITAVLLGVGGAVLGAIYRQVELSVMSLVTPAVASMMWHISSIIQIISGSYPIVTYIVFGPMMVLLAITFVDYWRGRD